MKRVICLSLALLAIVLSAQFTSAQSTNSAVKSELLSDLDEMQDKIISLAKAVPDDKYSWRPGDGVRSVSEVYMHIAGGNYYLLSFVGQKMPDGMQDWEKTVTEKAKVLDALQKSFDHVRTTINGMSDADMDKKNKVFGKDRTYREVLMLELNHLHEHLGQSIAYARSNGVVPPWTAAEKKEGK